MNINSGLEGVVAAQTRLSMVDGEAGELVISGYPLAELASHATFEESAFLLWYGALPDQSQLRDFSAALASVREIGAATVALLQAAAEAETAPMDALRIAAGTVSIGPALSDEQAAIRLLAQFPTMVAAFDRIAKGHAPIAPAPALGHAANFLYMLDGARPSAGKTRGLETYLNTVADHGLNASTFTARVITSTGSDFISAITGAVGALKGPLHGGAPGPALDMVFEIGNAESAEPYLRRKIESGEKLMGFGHRVYKVRDPRADVLAAAAKEMFHDGGDLALYTLAGVVEQTAIRLLEEYKPGRRLQTNVEFYTALLLHGLGLETRLFTPTFAISRVAGWLGHCFEQRRVGRLIRPQSVYEGPVDLAWLPLSERPRVAHVS